MAAYVLPFEKPLVALQDRIQELRNLVEADPKHKTEYRSELRKLEQQATKLSEDIFGQLGAWEKVQLSRHPARPYTLDYVSRIMTDFVELAGDRVFGEDAAIVAGLARFQGRSVAVVGHQKGRGAKDSVKRNFGMPHPEGYRKAKRVYELAARFRLPLFTFIDTMGAYPGIGAEERGQSEAIGACLAAMARLEVPVIATVIGEGGSGGALALGLANHVQIMEYGTYSVITPEGCASILWKDGSKAPEAAKRLKITATDVLEFGVVDSVIKEPTGGAHRDFDAAAALVAEGLRATLATLAKKSRKELVEERYARFRKLGVFEG
jgi:acetyl-CoA carboxylase carboxyl transferase subunit alpha